MSWQWKYILLWLTFVVFMNIINLGLVQGGHRPVLQRSALVGVWTISVAFVFLWWVFTL